MDGATLRVGIIGYGGAGRGIHGRLLAEVGERVAVVVTRNPERADAARADWPGVVVVPGVDELLARAGDLDLVVLASPTGEHRAHALAVIAAGVPLVVDKPLAATADAAQEVVDAAAAAGIPLTVFHNRRWDDEQRTLRRLLDEGALGAVHRFERRWERWRPVPQQRWKENAVGEGGGLLLDLGAHLVDAAVQLFGPARSVYAELRALRTPADDDVFLALEHASGVLSHLQAGSLAGAPGPRTRVLGGAGAYLVTSFEGEVTPFARLGAGAGGATGDAAGGVPEAEREGWLARGAELVPVRREPGGHADFYRAVRAWLRDGGPVPVDPRDAVRTARVLDAARVSAAERRVVALDPEGRIDPVDNGSGGSAAR